MLRDAGRLPGGPTLLAQKNFLVGPRSDPPKPAGAQSSPSPSPSPSPSSPSCPQSPSPEEKSGAFFRASSSLSVSSFSAICLRKKNHPATRAIPRKPNPVEPCVHAIPSCCDGGVSLMRRDRPFRGRLPGGPDIGLPAAPASLSERVPVVPQIPLRRNNSTDKAEMFLKDGNRPISLALFSPTIRQRKGKGRRARRKKRTRDSKTPDRESSLFDTCVQGQ